MLGVESIVKKIEVLKGDALQRVIEPQVKKFYQKEGQWYAVIQFYIEGSVASMHVALGS